MLTGLQGDCKSSTLTPVLGLANGLHMCSFLGPDHRGSGHSGVRPSRSRSLEPLTMLAGTDTLTLPSQSGLSPQTDGAEKGALPQRGGRAEPRGKEDRDTIESQEGVSHCEDNCTPHSKSEMRKQDSKLVPRSSSVHVAELCVIL